MNDFIGAILPFVVLSIVPGLLINFYITSKFVRCAEEKGHYNCGVFPMCFFFGIAGWLYVIALPDRKPMVQASPQATTQTEEPTTAQPPREESKGAMINADRYRCQFVQAGEKTTPGVCLICIKRSQVLYITKIKNRTGLRELPTCPDCIALFNAHIDPTA